MLANNFAAWPNHWQELATSQRGLGMLESQSGRWLDAKHAFMCSTDSLRKMIQIGNAQPEHQLMLASVLGDAAKIVSQLDGAAREESKEWIAECREIVNKAKEATSDQAIQRQAQAILSDLDSLKVSANSMDQESRS